MSKKKNDQQAYLPPASKKDHPLFSTRARTWVITCVAVAVFAFILVPLALARFSGANAVYIMTRQYVPSTPSPTPVPYQPSAAVDEAEAISATPQPTEKLHVSAYSQLQQNDDYPSVQQLQSRLMELGYLDSDEPSTKYNDATAVAVSLFQRTIQADMNGVADSQLQESLFSTEAMPYEIKLGDSGVDVERMQARLTELGYYNGKISGYYGTASESALSAFQKKNGLAVDAVFHVEDRDLLYSPSARPKIDPTPTPKPTPKPTKRPSSSSGKTSSPVSDAGSVSNDNNSGDSGLGTPSYSASYSVSGLLSVANSLKGYPYNWSQESPQKGFDCSGFVYYCLRTCGVSVSRYSASGFSSNSRWSNISSASELSAGDLVFFKNDTSSRVSHTGIYLGGSKFIHASSSSGKVIISNITTSYWTRNFVNGRRVF